MKFKNPQVEERLSLLHTLLQCILKGMDQYCQSKDVELVLTETVTTPAEDAALNRKSDTHSTRRAVDIRTKDWNPEFLKEFIEIFEQQYGGHGALNPAGNSQLLVYHDSGHGPHIHCQLSRVYALPPIEETI